MNESRHQKFPGLTVFNVIGVVLFVCLIAAKASAQTYTISGHVTDGFGNNISGATNAYYTLSNASSTDNGAQFTCLVSNSLGNVTSATGAGGDAIALAVVRIDFAEPGRELSVAGRKATVLEPRQVGPSASAAPLV